MPAIALTPLWIEQQRQVVAESTPSARDEPIPADVIETLDRIRDTMERAYGVIATELIERPQPDTESEACELLATSLDFVFEQIEFVQRFGTADATLARQFVGRAEATLDRLVELVRAVLVSRPDVALPFSPRAERRVFTVRVSPLAYLRAMWNLFWSAIRHPFSETTIDLSTGRVLYRS
jgi:hypothetical protein